MTNHRTSPELGIEAVARRSGLSQHLIRMWERRYKAVKPARTGSNRRLYSEDDAHRLELLNRAVHSGHRIGDIAKLSTAELEQLLEKDRLSHQTALRPLDGDTSSYIEAALKAIEVFDGEALSGVLDRADIDFGQSRALELVIMPLMERIGGMWEAGELRIAHEHMATAIVTEHIGSVLANFRYEPGAPVIVVATLLGQMHEAGALAAGVVAAVARWRPIYLGPNLPAEEIAGAAVKSGARAVALSLVYPADDPRIPAELTRLTRLLPDDVSILVGGRAAEQYRTAIDACAADSIMGAAGLRQRLEQIRANPRGGK